MDPTPKQPNVEPTHIAPVVNDAEAAKREAGMRIYSAILGHEPSVDPTAPDLLHRNRFVEFTDNLRERAAAGQLPAATPANVPAWRHLLEHAAAATSAATRRLDEARRRLRDRAA